MYPIMNGFNNAFMQGNPYAAGMMNPYMMMAMPPQTLEQFENRQKAMTEMQMNRINFMGKINPFASISIDERNAMQKNIFESRIAFSENNNPYSEQNIESTKQLLNQMNMMANPFTLGYGYPIVA